MTAAHMPLALLAGASALAGCAMAEDMPGMPSRSWHVRMAEGATGAKVDYIPEYMVGGRECWTGETGEQECLYWDGFMNVFEVRFEGLTETNAAVIAEGVRAAVRAACPSADAAALAKSDVVAMAGSGYRIPGSCPAENERLGQ